MKLTKLTENGKATDVAISPDGRYMVYVLMRESDVTTVLVEQNVHRALILISRFEDLKNQQFHPRFTLTCVRDGPTIFA